MLLKHRRTLIVSIAAIVVVIAAAIGYRAIYPSVLDYRKYLALSRLAREGQEPGYQRLLGEYLSDKGDDEEALKWYLKAADGGDSLAQNLVGSYYAGGLGDHLPPRVDYTLAREWFEKAAAQDLGISQYELCGMYHRGQGVKQDHETAYFWCSLAGELYGESAQLKQLSGETLDQEARRRVEARLTIWKGSRQKSR